MCESVRVCERARVHMCLLLSSPGGGVVMMLLWPRIRCPAHPPRGGSSAFSDKLFLPCSLLHLGLHMSCFFCL